MPTEAASSSTGTVPREPALVKYSYIRSNHTGKPGLWSSNWLEGRAGETVGVRDEIKIKAKRGKGNVSSLLPKPMVSLTMVRSQLTATRIHFWWLQRCFNTH